MQVTGVVREVSYREASVEALVAVEGVGWVWVGADTEAPEARWLRAGKRVSLTMRGLVEGWERKNGYGEAEMVYRPVGLSAVGPVVYPPTGNKSQKGWREWLLNFV